MAGVTWGGTCCTPFSTAVKSWLVLTSGAVAAKLPATMVF
jgi:hypothetical protein